MKNPLSPIQSMNKIKAQIKALNSRLKTGQVKNPYPVLNKIEALKKDLKIEMDTHYWENYLSI